MSQSWGQVKRPPSALSETCETYAALRKAIMALSEAEQQAVLLVYMGGCSHAEIGAFRGVTSNAVKTRLYSARRRLRRDIGDIERRLKGAPDRLAGVPPKYSTAWMWLAIQSALCCVRVASAKVQFDAPSTATNNSTAIAAPVAGLSRRSAHQTGRPAPWRIADPRKARIEIVEPGRDGFLDDLAGDGLGSHAECIAEGPVADAQRSAMA